MKKIIETTLLLVALMLMGCSDGKPRDFFGADGITIGTPTVAESGAYQIPITFETEIVHSGQWIDAVSTEVSGSDILITVSFTSTNRKSAYPGYIEVDGVSPGTYILKYKDPDGTAHVLGEVKLP